MNIRKAIAYGALVLSMGGYSVAAYAAEADNDTTGPHSTNNAWVNIENNLKADVENKADLLFDFDNIDVITGGNDVKYNTTAGDNRGGDVEVTIDLEGDLEQDSSAALEALGSPFGNGGNHSVSNDTTGPNSTNNAWVKEVNTVDLKVKNTAKIDVKEVDVQINTGNNDSMYNTKVDDTVSGSASLSFTGKFTIVQK